MNDTRWLEEVEQTKEGVVAFGRVCSRIAAINVRGDGSGVFNYHRLGMAKLSSNHSIEWMRLDGESDGFASSPAANFPGLNPALGTRVLGLTHRCL